MRSPRIRRRVKIPPDALERVRSGLHGVVAEEKGTGYDSRLEAMEVSGKTGTAQVVRLARVEGLEEDEIPIRHRDHAWFGALAPADAPRIAVAAFVEHGRHGSTAAAPVAQRILQVWYEKQGGAPHQVAGSRGAATQAASRPGATP